jgi:hypothetical protein
MELERNVNGGAVLAHLSLNVPSHYSARNRRDLLVDLAGVRGGIKTEKPALIASERISRSRAKAFGASSRLICGLRVTGRSGRSPVNSAAWKRTV